MRHVIIERAELDSRRTDVSSGTRASWVVGEIEPEAIHVGASCMVAFEVVIGIGDPE